MIEEKVKPSAFLVQTLATLSISYLTSLTGFIYAWPSYNVENFQSNATTLSEPMSATQISLLGSLTNLGALVVTPLCGMVVNSIGRKKSCMLFGLPYVLCWSMISLSNNVTLVLIAMTIAGMGAAGQVASSCYISEISQDSIRGGLASTTVSGYFIGLMASYAMGGYMSYQHVLYTHLTLSVLYMVLLMMLKESPVYLMQEGNEEEAKKSIAFYRRVSVTNKEVEMEISKIKLQLDPNIDKILQGNQDIEASKDLLEKKDKEQADSENISSWQFLMNSESSKRALLTVLILMFLTIMMGSAVLQVYAEPLLKEAAPQIPSNLAAILLAADFLIASLMCGFIVDKCGRKVLTTYSALLSGVCTLLLGFQIQNRWFPQWATVFIIYLYTFVYTFGAASVPFVLTAELFLPKVRGICNSLSMGTMWISNFLTLIIFNPLVQSVGLGPVFCGFSAVCGLTAAFSHFCLPETKGLSADAVQLLFLKKKKKETLREK